MEGTAFGDSSFTVVDVILKQAASFEEKDSSVVDLWKTIIKCPESAPEHTFLPMLLCFRF